jgi:3-dehydroquinate synthase
MCSLDARHISNGSAEVLKMACIKDAALFELLEAHGADVIASNYQVCVGCAAPHVAG